MDSDRQTSKTEKEKDKSVTNFRDSANGGHTTSFSPRPSGQSGHRKGGNAIAWRGRRGCDEAVLWQDPFRGAWSEDAPSALQGPSQE